MMKTKLQGMNHDGILNMEYLLILYSYHASKTLDVKGKKTVHARAYMANAKCTTLTATITVSEKMLTPLLIFKGKPICHSAMREFGTYPEAGKFSCQEMAWRDELKMHEWMDEVLTPWKAAQVNKCLLHHLS